jgi:hypothetical protein
MGNRFSSDDPRSLLEMLIQREPRARALFFISYLGNGFYAVDAAMPGAKSPHLAVTGSCSSARELISLFERAGDLIVVPEAVRMIAAMSHSSQELAQLAANRATDPFANRSDGEVVGSEGGVPAMFPMKVLGEHQSPPRWSDEIAGLQDDSDAADAKNANAQPDGTTDESAGRHDPLNDPDLPPPSVN